MLKEYADIRPLRNPDLNRGMCAVMRAFRAVFASAGPNGEAEDGPQEIPALRSPL